MFRPAQCIAAVCMTAIGASAVYAARDKVNLPKWENHLLYGRVDRADNKQVRELYVEPPSAVDAAGQGKPLPDGTVLTMVAYRAKLDDEQKPVTDSAGGFQKAELAGVFVMEKRSGWGTEYPADLRNGEWEYQAFTPAGAVNEKANIANCFKCHKAQEAHDFVFSYQRLGNPRAP